tara:strand:+ start:201 stop:782 length:582 start_codon:yes stop_codon:yes gene_type:complete
MASITSLPSGVTGSSLVLISEQTASSSSTISFTSGIDSTYKEYIFKFIDIHPSAEGSAVYFEFNGSADSGSNYNVTKTSTYIEAYHNEAGDTTSLQYSTTHDLAQSTSFQRLITGLGNDNDQANAGTLHLFDPSNTTFVKHFISNMNRTYFGDYTGQDLVAGYFNTTSAIDAVQFKMNSGNIDAGTIKMYGVV